MEKKGSLSINSENIFPIIKKWLYSDHDIFIRELVSNGCDAITKLKKLALMGDYQETEGEEYKIEIYASAKDKTLTFVDNGIGMTEEEVEKYINQIAFSGATDFINKYKDKTNEDPNGDDYVLKGTMEGAGTLQSTDSSYYKLTALNWELNQAWKKDPAKVVVSYEDDIAQGDVEARPIVDKIIYGMTDMTMFSQGTVSHFMQAVTTTMAVDISKTNTFAANQDDIRYTIDSQRTSVSGVDENEEAADLTKFQNLYNLASKVISVLNEVYDKLINQTGV